jgi:hypothetical protein
MYDFWFTLGSAIMNPSLLAAINAVPPVFNLVDRTITETAGGAVTFNNPNTTTAGLLDQNATGLVRDAIWNFLQKNPAVPSKFGPPPISIYTAGKFCQLLTIPAMGFAANVSLANSAYTASLKGALPATFSGRFPAYLGLCLVDAILQTKLAAQAPDPDVNNSVAQFGIDSSPTSTEWPVITGYAAHPSLTAASSSLLAGAASPWLITCGDQFLFWAPNNERAIL